jgi:GNAT superfamily N-acetyltransferase
LVDRGWEIRLAESDEDFDLWAAIRTGASPRIPVARPLRMPGRLLLLAGEVGCARATPSDLEDRAAIDVYVLPEARECGLGSELFERCVNHARGLGAAHMMVTVDELSEPGRAFARTRGFIEVDREVELRRTVGDEREPDPLPGISVASLAERPDLLGPTYEAVARDAYAELPLPSGFVTTLEKWIEEEEAGVAEASFIALDGDAIVGYAGMQPGGEHGLTAVSRTHRRRGIATYLKRRQLAWAARAGLGELVTFTQSGNSAMQKVNERLGYVPEPAWLKLRAAIEPKLRREAAR